MNRYLSFLKQTIITLIIAFTSSHLSALGVGDITLESSLGFPLLATIPLTNFDELNAEEIHIKQAPIEMYEKLGVSRGALYKTLLFDVDENKVLTVSSKKPIKEPYLHFVLQLRWPEGEIFREVKLLIDPPSSIN
ncbi:MAG: hypothetical protein JKY66_01120 [Spongiibacteraceae bacterium]|nr:hypothetical protein [Spongiibacteraceae bacterium]MBN4055572.1 hypothetical protein [bacterium AH-315-K03]